MMTIVRFGEQMIVKAMSITVFPFVLCADALALYLIRSGTARRWKRCRFDSRLPVARSCG